MTITAAIGFAGACAASLAITPLVRWTASRIGLTDRPDSHRKLHGQPTPLGGGVAVFLATALVLGAVLLVPNPWNLRLNQDWYDVFGFFSAGAVVLAIGLIDDRVGLRGRHKLLGQLASAGLLISTGLLIEKIGLFGWHFDLGPLAVPFTLFWLVGAVNAVNLLDGMDGLATSIGIILSITIAAMAAMTGHPAVAFVAVVFAGSLLGFLRFNFPPASIFLGDAGSMLIGLMVGAMAIRASLKGAGTVLLAAPVAVLAVPILDSAAAILRRKLTGRSIYTTDRGHLHHRLLDRFGTNSKVLLWIMVFCAATSAAALASVFLKNDLVALVSCAGLMMVFLITGIFGRGEFLLLAGRARNLGRSLVHPLAPNGRGLTVQTQVRLQGSRQWELLWESLTESAEKLGLRRIQLDLNLPMMQESFNATWEQPSGTSPDRCWQVGLPLMMLTDEPVGRITVQGERNGTTACDQIERLLELLGPFEDQLRDFTQAAVPALAGAAGRAAPRKRRGEAAAGDPRDAAGTTAARP